MRLVKLGVKSNRGGGVGGAPPPRSGYAAGKYPTVSHFATQTSSFVPPDLRPPPQVVPFFLLLAKSAGGRPVAGQPLRAPIPSPHAPSLCPAVAACRPRGG